MQHCMYCCEGTWNTILMCNHIFSTCLKIESCFTQENSWNFQVLNRIYLAVWVSFLLTANFVWPNLTSQLTQFHYSLTQLHHMNIHISWLLYFTCFQVQNKYTKHFSVKFVMNEYSTALLIPPLYVKKKILFTMSKKVNIIIEENKNM